MSFVTNKAWCCISNSSLSLVSLLLTLRFSATSSNSSPAIALITEAGWPERFNALLVVWEHYTWRNMTANKWAVLMSYEAVNLLNVLNSQRWEKWRCKQSQAKCLALWFIFCLTIMGERIANAYHLWCIWQLGHPQLDNLEKTGLFVSTPRVMLLIWTAKIWQSWASDHLEKLIMCNLFQLIWKPSISSKLPPRVNSEWTNILQILLIRFTRVQGIMTISPQLWCLMGITKPLIFWEKSLFGLTFQIPHHLFLFSFFLG